MVSEVEPEDVIASIGGCGRFQIVLSVVVHVIKTVVCWSFALLVFAIKVPKWVCLDSVTNGNESMSVVPPSDGNWNVSGFKSCEIGNDTKCTSFGFDRTLQTVSVEVRGVDEAFTHVLNPHVQLCQNKCAYKRVWGRGV